MAELLLNNKGSMEEALRLEADVWALLDTLVALATRVRGSRPALPYGLLQLRPPPAPRPVSPGPGQAAADTVTVTRGGAGGHPDTPRPAGTNADSDSSDHVIAESATAATADGAGALPPSPTTPSASASDHLLASRRYAYAASEGMDLHAHPRWPPLRRAARLTWAASAVLSEMQQTRGEERQAILETCSVCARLRYVSAVLAKHVRVLAAVAAVQDSAQQQ